MSNGLFIPNLSSVEKAEDWLVSQVIKYKLQMQAKVDNCYQVCFVSVGLNVCSHSYAHVAASYGVDDDSSDKCFCIG